MNDEPIVQNHTHTFVIRLTSSAAASSNSKRLMRKSERLRTHQSKDINLKGMRRSYIYNTYTKHFGLNTL